MAAKSQPFREARQQPRLQHLDSFCLVRKFEAVAGDPQRPRGSRCDSCDLLKKASVIQLFEQSFQIEDLQQKDDYHMGKNYADALVLDAEPYPCKDRVNEWLLRKVKNPPLEMIRH